jgi:FAD:protein FMN transferase
MDAMLTVDGLPHLPQWERPAPAAADLAAGDVYAFHDACVLGTRMNLWLRADGQADAYAAAWAARRETDRLARVFDWRDPASELSGLNRAARHQASAELFEVVAAAERWRELSAGAYSGRLGRLLQAWRAAGELPAACAMAKLARDISGAEVGLDAGARLITRPAPVLFDLDGLAKGYIVDRALAAALGMSGAKAAMVDIGGDIRCAGSWRVELPAPLMPFDNAPACGAFALENAGIATSGCGPRDRKAGQQWVSATLDPRDGWPVAHRRSATAIAPTTMDADALATAMLVSSDAEAKDLIARTPGLAARVATPDGAAWHGREMGRGLFQWIDYEAPQPGGAAPMYKSGWENGWIANITFTAPPKDMRREIAFRSPYVGIWVSDESGKPVRTLLLIGRNKEWHEGNHVWWRLNRAHVDEFFSGRSMSTRGSGTYKVYWDGIDDAGRPVKPGRYVMHVETSREGGGHAHRTLSVDFSTMRAFEQELPVDAQSGGLLVSFEKFGPG